MSDITVAPTPPAAAPAPGPTAPSAAPAVDQGLSDREYAEALAAMPATAAMARRETRDLGRTVRQLLVHQLPLVLLFSLLGLAVGLLVNSLVRRIVYGSFAQVPAGAPVAGSNNVVYGQIATFLMTAIIVGLIGYRLQVGRVQFRHDMRELPKQVVPLLRHDGRGPATIHILWGFAVSLAVILVIGTALGALFAAGTVLAFGTVVRPLVSSVLMTAFRRVGSLVVPRHVWPPSSAAMVALMGSVLGAVAAILVQDMVPRIVIAGLAAALAVVLGRVQAAHVAAAPAPSDHAAG